MTTTLTGDTAAVPSSVRAIRDAIDHPMIDSDGHFVEFMPLLLDLLTEVGGSSLRAKFLRYQGDAPPHVLQLPLEERRALRLEQRSWWGLPSAGTVDRVASLVPGLARRRLDEIGFDFAFVYPTVALTASGIRDDELRLGLCRAANLYAAQVFADVRDRLEPVAVIPLVNPDEAVAELRYAVGELGLRAVVMGGVIPRTMTGADGRPVEWLDHLGHESSYDYDPVWATCLELGVVPTFHAKGAGWGSRMSTSNYVYNHLGDFAAAQEATCRSLVMGGVPRRFPGLRFAFLEGGISWASQLFADLVSHFEKRNKDAIVQYDPAAIDRARYEELFRTYASGPLARYVDVATEGLTMRVSHPEQGFLADDFAESGIERVEDIVEIFTTQFFFGCEADDRMSTLAFEPKVHPRSACLNPLLSSDVGHWDVPDSSEVLEEAWELVETGAMTPADFERFACRNVVRMVTDVRPDFFAGTAVEGVEPEPRA